MELKKTIFKANGDTVKTRFAAPDSLSLPAGHFCHYLMKSSSSPIENNGIMLHLVATEL